MRSDRNIDHTEEQGLNMAPRAENRGFTMRQERLPRAWQTNLWDTLEDLPFQVREAVIWRIGLWDKVAQEDWDRLGLLVGSGRAPVIQMFEAERLRWAVKHLLDTFPQLSKRAAIKAVAIVTNKSPARIDQVYRRKVRRVESPYDFPIDQEAV